MDKDAGRDGRKDRGRNSPLHTGPYRHCGLSRILAARFGAVGLAVLSSLPVGVGGAEAAHQLVRSVRAGKATIIAYNYYFFAGCVPAERPRVDVLVAPQNGTVRVLPGKGKVSETNHSCFGRPSNSVGVLYTPQRGFRGTDGFVVKYTFPDGRTGTSRYQFPVE